MNIIELNTYTNHISRVFFLFYAIGNFQRLEQNYVLSRKLLKRNYLIKNIIKNYHL